MEIKSKHEPGKEPALPCKQGMTEKAGLTKREYVALELFVVGMQALTISERSTGVVYSTMRTAITLADEFLLVLNPPPVTQAAVPQKELSSCQHEGEWISDNMKGQMRCMKCKLTVPYDQVLRRFVK